MITINHTILTGFPLSARGISDNSDRSPYTYHSVFGLRNRDHQCRSGWQSSILCLGLLVKLYRTVFLTSFKSFYCQIAVSFCLSGDLTEQQPHSLVQ